TPVHHIQGVLDRNAPDIALRVLKAETESPTRPLGLIVQFGNVVKLAYLLVSLDDRLLGLAVDRERKSAKPVTNSTEPLLEHRLGQESENDAVRALKPPRVRARSSALPANRTADRTR